MSGAPDDPPDEVIEEAYYEMRRRDAADLDQWTNELAEKFPEIADRSRLRSTLADARWKYREVLMHKDLQWTRPRRRGPLRPTDDQLAPICEPLDRFIELLEWEPNQIMITAYAGIKSLDTIWTDRIGDLDFEELYATIERLEKLRGAVRDARNVRDALEAQMLGVRPKKSRRGAPKIIDELHGMVDVLVRYWRSLGNASRHHFHRPKAGKVKDRQRTAQTHASEFVEEAVRRLAPRRVDQVATVLREFTEPKARARDLR
jgi:hypothetical protein